MPDQTELRPYVRVMNDDWAAIRLAGTLPFERGCRLFFWII